MESWDSAAVLKTVLESSNELIMVVDLDYKLVYINQLHTSMTMDEVLGRHICDFTPADREKILACFERVVASAEPDGYETRYEEAGEESIWVSRVLPVLEEGVVQSIAILSRNVTEGRKIELERERFFKLSNDLLCTAGLDGRFRFVAPSFTTLLGFSREELLASPFVDFVHPDDRQATTAAVAQVGADGRIDDFENRYRTKDGGYRLIYWSAVYDLSTQLIYAVGRDITDKRRLEEQVLQSQKLDAVGQLAGGLAHDFNNLLLAVMMNADMAMRRSGSDAIKDNLEEIVAAGERASSLTQQLLAFSKSEVFEPVNLDLRDLVDRLHGMVRRLIPESIEISLEMSDEPVTAFVDRGQIEQVVINLCLNARDAMPESGGRLRILVEPGEGADGEKTAALRVFDNGSGMSPEVQKRIFEPFYTTKDRGTGTGLGLSSVYTIVSRHSGKVSVKSELGKGTEMRVCIPLSRGKVTRIDTPMPPPDVELFSSQQKILVAEDDPQVRSVVVALLESVGLEVLVAEDGSKAMDLAATQDVDLALLDLVMPKCSGHEVFLALRERSPQLPVVFSTGYSDGELPSESLADERVALVRKPYRPEDLLSILRRFLQPAPTAR